jgi:type IV pilus assembly protein PilN
MIRINLLPYRAARSKENIRKQISVFLLSFALLIIVLVVYNSHLSSKMEGLSSNLANLKKEVAIYEAKAKQVEEIKKKLDTLNKQIEIVNQLKEYREKPPKLLAKMTEMVISGRMQLTRLISDDSNLSLHGVALDNETIAVFMLRLERSGLFSGVVLASSKQINKYNVNMKQFNINCKKAALKEAAPASK